MISLKSSSDLDKMRVAGKTAAFALTTIQSHIKPGITTLELDAIMDQLLRENGCIPAFLNYQGFGYTSCFSVNEQVVHCAPSNRVLQNGDILTIDTGALFQGFYSDTAKTFLVGDVRPEVRVFVENAYQALVAGIRQVKDGGFVSDISRSVAQVITAGRYGIVKEYVGHGIGKALHEAPQIPNFPFNGKGAELTTGMVLAIEPITTMRSPAEVVTKSQWEIVTKNGDFACHWEHTIALTENGPEVLTKRPEECL